MKATSRHLLSAGLAFAAFWGTLQAIAADSPESLDSRDARIRQRYEQVLERNPFQDRAFAHVFESYLNLEGVDAWIEKLKPRLQDSASKQSAGIVIGQIFARQFRTEAAIATLENVSQGDQNPPEYNRLLGTLYYREGENEKGITLLTEALTSLTELEARTQVSRMLGNLFLREGNTEKAIEVWQQVTAQSPNDLFAQLELGDIYQENRLWDEAIEVYRHIASLSDRDPYRKCRALRSVGNCQLQAENYPEAIATYEAALELVSPGNWLFEDLKLRLVQVYEDMGDLAGLVNYVKARLDQNPTDIEFRDLLAETYLRMNQLNDAETEYRNILDRNPRHAITFEKLIGLYQRLDRTEDVSQTYEKLIELFPADSDYLRRLGETHWRSGNIELAKQTWGRLIDDDPTAATLAELASWYEIYDFPDDAITYYQKAVAKTPNKEWTFRLAEHLYEKGENATAITTWESVLKGDESTQNDFAEVASILDAHQELAKAEKHWRSGIEKDPENLDFHLQLARNLMRQENFAEAVESFTVLTQQSENVYFQDRGETGRLDAYAKLEILDAKQKEWETELAENPESIEVISRLAKLYDRAGRRESALSLLEKRSQLSPNNTDFRRALIRSYKSNRLIDEAIEELISLAASDKTRARVYQQELLEIYLSLDLRDESIATAERIIEMVPGDAEARLDLAQVYGLFQRNDDALQQYRYALRLEPNEPDYHRQYGTALMQEKRYGEAMASFQKMLDTAKEDATRLSAVGSLALIHQYENSLENLIDEFSRRIRNTPKKLSAYKELARIYQESGNPIKSLTTLEEGLQSVDDKTPALQALIRAAYDIQDFQKVLNYYEQLIAQRGKPSAYEYEKLGTIYAQMGDLSKARSTWEQMITEETENPKAYDRLASILQRENFINEAIDYKEQAVALDEFDYKRRWEYAQMLASTERSMDAITELQKLLAFGDKQAKENPKPQKEKTVKRRQRGALVNQQFMNPYMFIYGIQRYGQGYYGGSPRGSFAEIRPQVIGFMASLAQNSIGEETLIEQFLEKVQQQPQNTQAKRDLMLVYQSYGRVEDALKIAREVLKLAPNDSELIQQTALYYASNQEHSKAIPLLERLAEEHPKQRSKALQGLIPLYFQTQEDEKAIALTEQMLEENPGNYQTVSMIAAAMQQQGKVEQATKILARARKNATPQYAHYMGMSLAQMYSQQGNQEEAKKLFTEILITDPRKFSGTALRRPRAELYMPALDNSNPSARFGGAAIMNLPPAIIGRVDYQKAEAVRQLRAMTEPGENPIEPLTTLANEFTTAKSAKAKDDAWDAAKLIVAYHLAESEFDEAQAWLETLAESASDRLEWLNLSLYLAEEQDDCAKMVALYQAAEDRFPSYARKLVSAKAAVSLLCENYADASTHIRQMIHQRVPPKELVTMIQPLINAEETELAKTLLEEHLAGVSRNGEALALLAKIYAEEEKHEEAIALAREAWDRSSHGKANQNYRYVSFYPGPTSRPTDTLLRNLHQYHVQAGKSDQLVEEFSNRLKQQPGSVRLHENLALIHQLNNDRDKAIEVYESLIQKRPHLTQAKQTLARYHTEKGDFAKATAIYETLLKTNPNIYQQISWQLRDLYQRSGKGKEIVEMENKLASRATNPNQIQQLANQFERNGEFEKAAELYRKAIKMSPGYPWLNRQLANVYIQQGKHDDAIELYRQWLASPTIRAQGNVDTGTLQHLTGVYASTGRLEELKTIHQGFLEKNAKDPIALGLTAQIALFEKRFDDAIAELAKVANTGRDPNALNGLLEVGELTGRIDAVFDSIKDPALIQTFYDKRRIAKIYLAKGDYAKGTKVFNDWIEEQSRFQGPRFYNIREAINSFSEHGLWDEAEAMLKKYNRSTMQEYDRREFSRIVSDFYVQSNQLGDFVEAVLAKDNYKGSDIDLITAISNGYRNSNQPQMREAFLSRVVNNDSTNSKLVSELVQLHLQSDQKDRTKALELATQLVSQDPSSETHRKLQADTLFSLNRNAEAITMLTEWAQEKESENRYRTLARFQERNQNVRGARESLQRAAELADSSRKQAAKLAIAEFDAKHGSLTPIKEAQKARFDAQPDANSFSRHLTFLRQYGYFSDAYSLILKHKDDGYLDRYRNSTLFEILTDEGDFKTPIELAWNFIRYSERYNRENAFRTAEQIYRNRGKIREFLEAIQTKVEAEETPNIELIHLLAKTYADAGLREGADTLYTKLADLDTYNQTYALARAGWLSKTGRTSEAIEIVNQLPPAPTLREEVQNQIRLIGFLIQNDSPDRAESVITELLSWNADADTRSQIGDLYFQEKAYERALQHYESTQNKYRRNSYSLAGSLINMGKCYAYLGKADKAIEAFNKAKGRPNSSYLINQLTQWMEAEGLHAVGKRYLEVQFETSLASIPDIQRLAQFALKSDGLEAAIEVFHKHWESGDESTRTNLGNVFASFITTNKLAESLAQTPNNALVEESWAQIISNLLDSPEAAAMIEDAAPILHKIQPTPEIELKLGLAKLNLNRSEEAESHLSRALESIDARTLLKTVETLAKITPTSDQIVPAILKAMENWPDPLTWTPEYLEIFVRHAPEATVTEAIANALERLPFEAHKRYYRFLVAHLRNNAQDAQEHLSALCSEPSLSAVQLKHLASICQTSNQVESAVVFLQRLTGGGYSSNDQWNALVDLTNLHLKAGNFQQAISTVSRLYPVFRHHQGQRAIKAVYQGATKTNLPKIVEGIHSVIASDPHHDRISTFIGIMNEIHEKLEMEPDLTSSEINETFSVHADLYSSFIETWEVSGPFEASSNGASRPAVSIDIPFAPETRPDEVTWTVIGPKESLGYIQFDSIFGLTEHETNNQIAYARTTLVSPDARSITIGLGSDDFIKLWVNDKNIHTYTLPRPAYPDQDLVQIPLKAGENQLLIKVGNLTNAWRFCARITENGDGVKVKAIEKH